MVIRAPHGSTTDDWAGSLKAVGFISRWYPNALFDATFILSNALRASSWSPRGGCGHRRRNGLSSSTPGAGFATMWDNDLGWLSTPPTLPLPIPLLRPGEVSPAVAQTEWSVHSYNREHVPEGLKVQAVVRQAVVTEANKVCSLDVSAFCLVPPVVKETQRYLVVYATSSRNVSTLEQSLHAMKQILKETKSLQRSTLCWLSAIHHNIQIVLCECVVCMRATFLFFTFDFHSKLNYWIPKIFRNFRHAAP